MWMCSNEEIMMKQNSLEYIHSRVEELRKSIYEIYGCHNSDEVLDLADELTDKVETLQEYIEGLEE